MKKPLSFNQARSCEEALRPRCRCRCGGKLHGAKRGNVDSLPKDDLHFPGRECPYCWGSGRQPGSLPGVEGWLCPRCKGAGVVIVGGP